MWFEGEQMSKIALLHVDLLWLGRSLWAEAYNEERQRRKGPRSGTAIADHASPAELKALDNFRFEHRMPSWAAAVRELLRQGLGVGGGVEDNAGIEEAQRAGSGSELIVSQSGPSWNRWNSNLCRIAPHPF